MSEATGAVPLSELRANIVTVAPGIEGSAAAEEEALRPLVTLAKGKAIEFAQMQGAEPWLLEVIQKERYLDGLVSDMRHLTGGQDFILHQLEEVHPNLKWYRGGTLRQWREAIGPASHQHFTDEQLNTHVIDGGQNGILGKPSTALNFLRLSPRPNPALYTLTLDSLILGLQTDAISLGSEHQYDLNVMEGSNRTAYLDFCRNNLVIQQVKLD